MDGFAFQFEADAAEAEGYTPEKSAPSTPRNEAAKDSAANDSTAKQSPSAEGELAPKPTTSNEGAAKQDTLPSFGSMFGFAASWGKKLQADLQIDQFVDSVKKQSEEVTKAYKQDISEFAQAVKVGATRGMDELSTRFAHMKTGLETELNASDTPAAEGESREIEVQQESTGLFQGMGRHFQIDSLKQRQEKAKRLMSKLGTDLEDLLRDAIVIEAPGSGTTEEQRKAARKIIYDRRMAQLAAVQENEDTYLVNPSTTDISIPGGVPKSDKDGDEKAGSDFEEFIKTFKLEDSKDKVTELLKDGSAVAEMHKTLVPDRVAEEDFWTRYFFNAWLIDQAELRRKKLVEAAVAATEEEEFSWDMEGESDSEDKTGDEKQDTAEAVEPAKEKDMDEEKKDDNEDNDVKIGKSKAADIEEKEPKAREEEDDDAWDEWE
ncbi:hypothetical protein DL89DRAFT_8132 [Linderina pennispora]|uniref:BSD domain-containing protein n=1 Tax=Linderina pennispora TaxID=61395 RepID=A0A1Y1WKK1_9FUNG|nr:uncharacterized protein DL89DRAFT_8132 [Linderina pennispora]ORX74012.1 hypothetical protein DL89DRAFT_8132 [Linderina pennispora]